MDWVALRANGQEAVKKYRFVLLVLLAGLLLMAIPEKKETTSVSVETSVSSQETLEEELAGILSKIQGAGKVEVLLTEYTGSETLYQTDVDQDGSDTRRDTVIITDSGKAETGLVRQVNPPKYLGALIVCQGGDSPSVKLAVMEAVMRVTGLSSNQISVLKMK